MVKYALRCSNNHSFEGWFSNSAAYENERAQDRISCPYCGIAEIEKQLMAPSVSKTKGWEPVVSPTEEHKDIAASQHENAPEVVKEAMKRVREFVEQNAEYVEESFAEEARKIHYDETETRDIFGEASTEEVAELLDEGIDVCPLPRPPEKQN